VLVKALSSGCALELAKLYLGGNKLSPAGLALGMQLKQMRGPDLVVDFKQQLRDARSLCQVKRSTGHTHTHTTTENNTPDTDTHTHTSRTTPETPKRTPPTNT